MSIVQVLCLGLVGIAIVRAQSYGALRLARGSSSSTTYTSGRLEIYINGQWGTVCDDSWDSTDSAVACRQLGYSGAARPTSYRTSSNAGYGSGTGRIWLDDVDCTGFESRLTSCTNRGIGSHNCRHSEDVAIYCAAGTSTSPTYGSLRLARGSSSSTTYTSGRLEIYINGQWGTVCDDSWDSTDSDVACRQLGYSGAARPTSYRMSSSAGYGTGTGRIWLDDVDCTGFESRLTYCSNRGIGSHNCLHSEDVAIYCVIGTRSCFGSDWRCNNGQCISSYQHCNGYQGCSDGSDELNCVTCSSRTFQCNNRQCVPSSGHCDGNQDCSDGSDEINCTLSIIIGTTFGVLGLVMVLWCIAFFICMKVSTCPLHNIYYKKTIQNLAETPLGTEVGGVTTLHPPPSQAQIQQTTF